MTDDTKQATITLGKLEHEAIAKLREHLKGVRDTDFGATDVGAMTDEEVAKFAIKSMAAWTHPGVVVAHHMAWARFLYSNMEDVIRLLIAPEDVQEGYASLLHGIREELDAEFKSMHMYQLPERFQREWEEALVKFDARVEIVKRLFARADDKESVH